MWETAERESNGSQRIGRCITSRSKISDIGCYHCHIFQHWGKAKQRQALHVMDMGDMVSKYEPCSALGSSVEFGRF